MQYRHVVPGVCALAAALLPLASVAADARVVEGNPGATHSHVFLGAGIGHYRMDGEDFVEEGDRLSDNRTAYRLFGGAQINRYLALEAGYVDFGEANESEGSLETDGFTLAGLIHIPLLPNFAPYGKVGHMVWDAEGSMADNHRDYSGNDWLYGVGGRFDLSDRLALRLEYDRYTMDESDVDMASISLQVRF